jgi:foldase protein PrsA
MRISRKLAALGAFFVLAAAIVAGCGSSNSVSGTTVASMAGNKISIQAYKHWMYVAAKGNSQSEQGTPVIVPSDPPKFASCIKQVRLQLPQLASTKDPALTKDCAQLFAQLNPEVMGFLVESYWYQADAYKAGIRLSAKQINAAYEKARKAQFPTSTDYKTFLTTSGQTDADIRFRVRVNTLYAKLLKRYTTKVTPAAIAAYYKKNASSFGTPETRDVHIVLTKTKAAADQALSALKSGQSWDVVAKKYSTDTSSKDTGGLLTGIEKGQEEHALDTVAFSSPVNKLEGPVHGTFGWYDVEVAKITPATHESQAKANKLIKQELTQKNQQAAENQVTKLSKREWGKKTTCAAAFAAATYCANYKAPKTTPTSATPTPTPTAATSTPTAATTTPATSSTPASATPTASTPASSTPTSATTTNTASATPTVTLSKNPATTTSK